MEKLMLIDPVLLLLRYSWLKNPEILLAKGIFNPLIPGGNKKVTHI